MMKISDFLFKLLFPKKHLQMKILENDLEIVSEVIHDVCVLINNSKGVYGLHLNGKNAPWQTLLDGGEHEQWLWRLELAKNIAVETRYPQLPEVT